MAGSIADNIVLYKKKSFVYVPPTTPSDLIESTSITLDFAARKFIQIGLHATEDFEVIIRILTSSRPPENYKRTIFLETETEKISSMVYGGENVLVVESKSQEGCRILLNRSDLIRLQYLEGTIFEIIHRTTTYTHTLLSKQVRAYIKYLEEKFSQMQSPPVNEEEIIMFIKKNTDYQIVQSGPILTSQIQLFAAAHVADRLMERKARNSPMLFDGEHAMQSPTSPSYSPLPTHHTFNHAKDNFLYKPIDHFDGPMPPDSQQQSVDVNDGPNFYNLFYSPPAYIEHAVPTQKRSHSTFTEHPTPARNVKPHLF